MYWFMLDVVLLTILACIFPEYRVAVCAVYIVGNVAGYIQGLSQDDLIT